MQSLNKINERIAQEGVSIHPPMLKYGDKIGEIIRTADQLSANVIMLGSGKYAHHKSNKLGSTANKIMRQSERPVWVVKKKKVFNISSILCPVDFSAESKRAMDNAIVLARHFNSKLIICSVYELYDNHYPRFNTKNSGLNNLVRREHERRLNAYLYQFNFSGVDYENLVQAGNPAKEILTAIRKHHIDLLVMGTTTKLGLQRILMGSVTEKVTRELPCSFTTLKADNILTADVGNRSNDVEYHYDKAMHLLQEGKLKESIPEFMICLQINDMHLLSLLGLAEVNQKLGNMESSVNYMNMAQEIITQLQKQEEAQVKMKTH